jgi:hypothetical protein
VLADESKTAKESRGTMVQSDSSNHAKDDQLNMESKGDQGKFNAESENQGGFEFHIEMVCGFNDMAMERSTNKGKDLSGKTVCGLNDMAMERDSNKGKDSSCAGIQLGKIQLRGAIMG